MREKESFGRRKMGNEIERKRRRKKYRQSQK